MIYFDHASTAFPKPKELIEEMQFYLKNIAASPGRGSFDSQKNSKDYVECVREKIASLFCISNSSHIIFTSNATHSLNIVLKGYLKDNDHVLICSYSHNSIIRPLEQLKKDKNIRYDVFYIDEEGQPSFSDIEKRICPETALVIFTHASNVLGVRQQFEDLLPYFKQHQIPVLVDVAQTAGILPLDVDALDIDFIAGTGHKTLLGPSGMGFLYLKNPELVEPLITGGSGGTSSSLHHPEIMPAKFEAGTLNYMGIAGLAGGLKALEAACPDTALSVAQHAWTQLKQLPGITLYGSSDFNKKIPLISFSIQGLIPKTIEEILAHEYRISTRAGLQCAPFCHRMNKTFPQGTLRISFGHTNTKQQVDIFISAIKEIIYGKTS